MHKMNFRKAYWLRQLMKFTLSDYRCSMYRFLFYKYLQRKTFYSLPPPKTQSHIALQPSFFAYLHRAVIDVPKYIYLFGQPI